MSLLLLLALVLCNVVWALNPVMGKALLIDYAPLQAAWLRYASAFLTVLLFTAPQWIRRANWHPAAARFRATWPFVALMGVTTFFLSPFFQFQGLHRSTATANALIIALEPLTCALLAWVILREAIKRWQWLGFLLATAGFCLLSRISPLSLQAGLGEQSIGNLFILLAVPAEAMHSILSRKLLPRISPLEIFGYALPIGFLILSAVVIGSVGLPAVPSDWRTWGAVLWIGPLGTALTYVFWSKALRTTPVATAALTLFVQPLFGALSGALFLGERLDLWQSFGALLIVSVLLLEVFQSRRPQQA